MKRWILPLALMLAGGAHAADENFKGSLFEKDGGRKNLLFRFTHEISLAEGKPFLVHNVFSSIEGAEAVVENVFYDKAGELARMSIQMNQTGEGGELDVKEGKVHFKWTNAEGKVRTAEEDAVPNLVVTATLVPYIQKHWGEIVKGNQVEIRFAALDRRETVGFKLFKVEEKKIGEREAMVVKMKASSLLISAIVDPLYFSFDKGSQRLLEYQGRTAPKRKVRDQWKDLDADIVYEYGSGT